MFRLGIRVDVRPVLALRHGAEAVGRCGMSQLAANSEGVW